jgi:DNA-binding NarL/FixJ family response regulator
VVARNTGLEADWFEEKECSDAIQRPNTELWVRFWFLLHLSRVTQLKRCSRQLNLPVMIDIITATVNATGTARRVAVLGMHRFAVHCGRGVLVAFAIHCRVFVWRCMTMKKKVVIVDDHDAVRELLCRYLERLPEYEVAGQAGTGLDAIRLFKRTSPNIAIIDLVLPELCGHEVISRARREFPEMRVVVFTGASDATVLAHALRSEPDGIVHKSERLEILLDALRTVSVGGRFYSPKLNKSVGRPESGSAQALSAREIEVMQSIAEGKSNKEIGRLLGVATKTVDNHRSRLMQKLGVHNAASLTLVAVQMGIVPTAGIPTDPFKSFSFSH